MPRKALAPKPPAAPPPPQAPMVQAVVIFKTGHRLAFECFAFRQVPAGYEFIDYPESRGFKTVTLIRSDAIASVQITAPETMLDSFSLATAAVAAYNAAVAPPPDYADGDPQHGPKSYVSRRPGVDPAANRSVPIPNAKGLPMSRIVNEDGQEEVVQASMVHMQ